MSSCSFIAMIYLVQYYNYHHNINKYCRYLFTFEKLVVVTLMTIFSVD